MIFYYCYWLLTLPLYIYIYTYISSLRFLTMIAATTTTTTMMTMITITIITRMRESERAKGREKEREKGRERERERERVCVWACWLRVLCWKNNQFLPEEDRRVYRSRAQPSIAGEEQRYPSSSNVLSPRVHGSLIVSRCRLTRATRGS